MNLRVYLQEKDDWDRNSFFYAIEARAPYKQILREEIFKKFLISKNHKLILDLGAGVGDLANDIMKRFGSEVVCVDFSEKMRREALRRQPNIKYVLASANKLPFKDSTFDMVIASGVLHHLKVQGILNEGLGEIQRVLKEGGLFCYLDRSSSFIARVYESLLALAKRFYQLSKKDYSASSTTLEVSLTKDEIAQVSKDFHLVSRYSIYSMPFKFLMVISNFFLYVLGERYYIRFQKLSSSLALFFEKYLNFRIWETEYCEVLRK